MEPLTALRKGWVRSTRAWQVLLVLFLVNLFGGLLLAVVPALELLGPAHYTAIRDAASGIPAWMAIETLFNPVGSLSQQAGAYSRAISSTLQTSLITVLLALGLLPGAAWLPGSLASGGLLLTYAEAADKFSWKRFVWGCWHYWGAFLLLGLLQTLLTLLVFGLLITGFSILIALIPWSALLLAPLAIMLIVLWTAFFELAQVRLVAGENRSIGSALRSGISLLRRLFVPMVVFYILSLGLLLGLHLIFQLGFFPHLPLAFWPLVLVLQQTFIIGRLWVHAARLAGAVEFARQQAARPTDASGQKETGLQDVNEDKFLEGLQPLD